MLMPDVEEACVEVERRIIAYGEQACRAGVYGALKGKHDPQFDGLGLRLRLEAMAAVRDAMLAAFDAGHAIGFDNTDPAPVRARIQALGAPVAGPNEGEEE
jgi:hypothetical protein